MELHIRSQNRESLIRYENLFYFNTCNEMESVGKNYILNKIWIGDKDCIVLGEYNSKERALEVLDEIQQFINNNGCSFISQDAQSISLNTYKVYEMPKE